MSNFMERFRLLTCIMRGNIIGKSPKPVLGRIMRDCISGRKNVAGSWMMARLKRLLKPSISVYPYREVIEQSVKKRAVILRKTRNGCGMRISGGEVFL